MIKVIAFFLAQFVSAWAITYIEKLLPLSSLVFPITSINYYFLLFFKLCLVVLFVFAFSPFKYIPFSLVDSRHRQFKRHTRQVFDRIVNLLWSYTVLVAIALALTSTSHSTLDTIVNYIISMYFFFAFALFFLVVGFVLFVYSTSQPYWTGVSDWEERRNEKVKTIPKTVHPWYWNFSGFSLILEPILILGMVFVSDLYFPFYCIVFGTRLLYQQQICEPPRILFLAGSSEPSLNYLNSISNYMGQGTVSSLLVGEGGAKMHSMAALATLRTDQNVNWKEVFEVLAKVSGIILIDGRIKTDQLEYEINFIRSQNLGSHTIILLDEDGTGMGAKGIDAFTLSFDQFISILHRSKTMNELRVNCGMEPL